MEFHPDLILLPPTMIYIHKQGNIIKQISVKWTSIQQHCCIIYMSTVWLINIYRKSVIQFFILLKLVVQLLLNTKRF